MNCFAFAIFATFIAAAFADDCGETALLDDPNTTPIVRAEVQCSNGLRKQYNINDKRLAKIEECAEETRLYLNVPLEMLLCETYAKENLPKLQGFAVCYMRKLGVLKYYQAFDREMKRVMKSCSEKRINEITDKCSRIHFRYWIDTVFEKFLCYYKYIDA